MEKQTVTFRLITGKKDGTYSVKRGIGLKDGILKRISYRPGAKSIFDEDNEKSAVKPEAVVFRYNDHLNDPAVEIQVPIFDKTKLDFLRTLSEYGRVYKEYDADKEALKGMELYDDKEKAFDLIRENDEIKVRAKAMVIFGLSVFSESLNVVRMKLKETADKNPKAVIKAFTADDYFSKYQAGLAFCAGIVENNKFNTGVVWADTKGEIIPVAKGENGIDKLAEFLAVKTKESETLLQEFSARLDKAGANEVNGKSLTENIVSAKDKKIAELEAQLKKVNAGGIDTAKREPVDTEGMTLEEASVKYIEITGNEVPVRYKNDLSWITSKLNA